MEIIVRNKFNLGDKVYVVLCHPDPVYREVNCSKCEATGVLYNVRGKEFQCNECNGKKYVHSTYDDFYSNWFVTEQNILVIKIVISAGINNTTKYEYCLLGLDKKWSNLFGHFANHNIQSEDRLFYKREEALLEADRLTEQSKLYQRGKVNQII